MKLKHLAVLLALSTMAADCPFGDKSSTGPGDGASVAGTYTLQKVNNVSLPAPYNDGGNVKTVSSGSVVMNANGTFTYSESYQGGSSDGVSGTWTKSGDVYTFDPAEQPGEGAQNNGTATITSGGQLTLSVTDGGGTTVRIYQKSS